jgi:hypothetical protein
LNKKGKEVNSQFAGADNNISLSLFFFFNMRWLIAGADLSSPDCVVGDGKSVSAATTTTSVMMMIYTIRALGRETLCLRADGDEESNCFIRTKQLAFSLYGRTRRRLPTRNGMPCAVIDFSYHSWDRRRRIHWNATTATFCVKITVSARFDFCAHIGLTAGLDMNETPRRVGEMLHVRLYLYLHVRSTPFL